MSPTPARLLFSVAILLATAAHCHDAVAHPWHRQRRAGSGSTTAAQTVDTRSALEDDRPDETSPRQITPPPVDPRFRLTAARTPGRAEAEIAAAFAPFAERNALTTRRDDRFFYVESNGIPDHPLMVGIKAWQQQVPLPQPYVGDNAWRIPLEPVPAAAPVSTRNRFLRGAIALAVNGVPIFNPLNNRGEDAFLIGELDEYGGHCGRADDYHYHVAPVHLEKQVGKGRPIAYALDGYPIYGYDEPDGSPVEGLDACGGHEDADGNYHYHATKTYPYLNGGFHGHVIERDGQVDPQPRAEPLRAALPPLRGAKIVGFVAPSPTSRLLTYEVGGRRGTVAYALGPDGAATFTYTDPSGRKTTETVTPRGRGAGGRGGPSGAGGRPPRREDGPAPPRPGEQRGPESGGGPEKPTSAAAGIHRHAPALVVRSTAVDADGRVAVEHTCDGAGVSPPLEWQAGPKGTKSYALVLWHEAPDRVKSYWVVHGIPATVTSLPKASRGAGITGLNDKRRAEYDPPCSRGPGLKTYHVTVFALPAMPKLPAAGADREALLAAVEGVALAAGTLTFSYERGAAP
jgi:phosphatidylethanolamine-binding protein (PEBP) family uncharacterized protein